MLFEKHTGFLRGRKRKPQLQKQLHVHPYYLLIYLFIKDRKSTRLNSSHSQISYAVFCLKKKKPKYSHANAKSLGPFAFSPLPPAACDTTHLDPRNLQLSSVLSFYPHTLQEATATLTPIS